MTAAPVTTADCQTAAAWRCRTPRKPLLLQRRMTTNSSCSDMHVGAICVHSICQVPIVCCNRLRLPKTCQLQSCQYPSLCRDSRSFQLGTLIQPISYTLGNIGRPGPQIRRFHQAGPSSSSTFQSMLQTVNCLFSSNMPVP